MTDTPFPPNAKVAAYLRDSGGARQDLSCDQQETVVREWCASHSLHLTAIFADRARPGGTTVGRVEFDKMVRHFQRGGAPEAGVIFWDLSRWARNFDDGQYFLSGLRRLGYTLHSLEQQIPSGSVGRVVESLHLWSAEEYRKELSRNVKRGLYYLIQAHHAYPRGDPPPGYRKYPLDLPPHRDGQPHVAHGLEPDPETADLVRRAFQMRVDGRTIPEIHAATGLFKYRVNYQYMLKNELYIGIFNFGSLRVENYCQPLIDRQTWDAVQAINLHWKNWRQEKNNAPHPRRANSPFLLSGLLHCAHCGAAMIGDYTKGAAHGYRYYVCGANRAAALRVCPAMNIRAEPLDAAVLAEVKRFLDSDNLVDLQIAAVRQALAEADHPDDEAGRLQGELAQVARSIRNVLDQLDMTGASKALAERLNELERKRDELEQKLRQAEQRLAARNGLDPAAASQAVLAARMRLGGDVRDQQLGLRAVVREIRVKRQQETSGEIVLRLPGVELDTAIHFGFRKAS